MTTLKMAIYRDTQYGNELALQVSDWLENISTADIRISEIVEIEFKPRQDAEFISAQADKLRGAIEKVKADAIKEVEKLETQLSELLALTHE